MSEHLKHTEQPTKEPTKHEADYACNVYSYACKEPITLKENMLMAFGNPLLDMLVEADNTLLEKYDLQPDGAILANKHHNALYIEMSRMANIRYMSGGSMLNVVRVFQWVLRKPFVSTFFGCIGTDKRADILINQTIADGVNAQYQQTSEFRTGRCAVLVNGTSRSLVADLGAAPHFDVSYLRRYANRKLYEMARYYLTSGYFLQSSPDTAVELGRMAHRDSCIFVFSLSSPLIVRECVHYIKALLPYVDIVFGNEAEALALGSVMGWKPNVKVIGKQVFMMKKRNPARQRIVVFTRGSKPVVVVQEEFVREYPVYPVPPDKIVDTNAAGDAFMGAFLAQYFLHKEISVCIMWGMWASCVVLKNQGCTFEGKPVIDQHWMDNYLKCCGTWINYDYYAPTKRKE